MFAKLLDCSVYFCAPFLHFNFQIFLGLNYERSTNHNPHQNPTPIVILQCIIVIFLWRELFSQNFNHAAILLTICTIWCGHGPYVAKRLIYEPASGVFHKDL